MTNFENRKAFNFYRSYYEMGQEMQDSDRLAFYDALLRAQFTGEIVEPSGIAKIVFKSQLHSIKQQIQGFVDVSKKTQLSKNQQETSDPCQPPTIPPTQGGIQGPTAGPSVHSIKNIENSIKSIDNRTTKELLTRKRESEFLIFWDAYDKKTERKDCFDKFKKLTDEQVKKILEVTPLYVKSTPDVKYRKNPKTWLNKECWNDEIKSIQQEQKPKFSKNRPTQ